MGLINPAVYRKVIFKEKYINFLIVSVQHGRYTFQRKFDADRAELSSRRFFKWASFNAIFLA
jgi:hypothetical protein